jgi:hypothetical protein
MPLGKHAVGCTGALQLKVKGELSSTFLVNFNWSFAELISFLQILFDCRENLLVYKNHILYDSCDLLLKDFIGTTFDCHDPDRGRLWKLKITKQVLVDETVQLPLNLNEIF